jgi:hypothetical protein
VRLRVIGSSQHPAIKTIARGARAYISQKKEYISAIIQDLATALSHLRLAMFSPLKALGLALLGTTTAFASIDHIFFLAAVDNEGSYLGVSPVRVQGCLMCTKCMPL